MAPEYDRDFFRLPRHRDISLFKGVLFECYFGIPSEMSSAYSSLRGLSVVLFEPNGGSRFQVSGETDSNSIRFNPDSSTEEGQNMTAHCAVGGKYIKVLSPDSGEEQVDLYFKANPGEMGFKSIWCWKPGQERFVSVQQEQVKEMHYQQGVSFVPVPGGELYILPTHLIISQESQAYEDLRKRFSL